jgi:hypothetical protein
MCAFYIARSTIAGDVTRASLVHSKLKLTGKGIKIASIGTGERPLLVPFLASVQPCALTLDLMAL